MSQIYYRYFTDNDKYGESQTPYLDSLAFVVQEFLYTEGKAKQEIKYKERVFDDYTVRTRINKITKSFDCEMERHIQLYDFVTMTLHLINTLPSDFAKVQLKEYLADLKQTNSLYSRNGIGHTQNNGIYLYNPSQEMIFALLWAAWIYMRVFLDLNPNKMLEKCVDMLYDAMKENYPSTAENLEKHPLIVHAPDAMTLMCQHIKAKTQSPNVAKSPKMEANEDGDAKLQTRIAELEAENKELKGQIELLQSPEGAPIDTEGHGTVRLELLRLLMDKAGAQWQKRGNKVIAAQLMSAITGLAPKTCKNHLSDPIVKHTEHQETILDVNSKLKALGIEITL